MNSFQRYAAHYLKALAASCFNAGVLAVKAGFAQAGGAAFTSGIPAPTAKEIGVIFAGAAVWEAINFIAAHPIPVSEIPVVAVTPPSAALPQPATALTPSSP